MKENYTDQVRDIYLDLVDKIILLEDLSEKFLAFFTETQADADNENLYQINLALSEAEKMRSALEAILN